MQKKVTRRIRRRKKNKRIFVFFIPFLLMVLIVSSMAFLFGRLKKEMDHRQQDNLEIARLHFDKSNLDETDLDEDNVDDGEWCLTLVNKWNPMKTDGSEVETIELSNGQLVDKRIYPQLQKMLDDARAYGVYPVVASGYRTWSKQEALYNEKIEEYKAEGLSEEDAKEAAESWVAIPGTSEHQLGLSVDINADGINSAGGEVYDWLARNAYKYGFINRYPSDKTDITGVANEPWHYRYVGIKAAEEINNRGICLEEYLE